MHVQAVERRFTGLQASHAKLLADKQGLVLRVEELEKVSAAELRAFVCACVRRRSGQRVRRRGGPKLPRWGKKGEAGVRDPAPLVHTRHGARPRRRSDLTCGRRSLGWWRS